MKLAIYLNQDIMAGGGYYESLNRISDLQGQASQVLLYTSNKGVFELLRNEGKEVYFVKLAVHTRFFSFLKKNNT